ncbi:DeoR/GlpR family DNA-binding transcription regulator [Caulobacter endophyticus]|uniref:DeoR/GlpR family DNA-binding transcription regulator n=1 Tax=Caulobacter endophyticus TaxID=2172652 RepID=UPI0024100193|nr:DeoR/GlpR family DNA-binding transcription regulator [Caulobacter endophyticus]MDG2530845.1 DeoR/GlpR family DNA-binding transcription regulator [Caulobacter endophyticus]
MLTSERKALVLRVLERDGRVVAKPFSQELGVSEDTIRRDLRELAAEGLLLRVHGGALPVSPAPAEFSVREGRATAEKARLARAAARLIQPGQIVFLDGGTTNVQLARSLPADLRATILTHSPSIAVELAGHPCVEVELIGGRLFKHSIVAVGAAAAEAIARVRADLFFMGATGLHPDTGVATGDPEEAVIKRLIARQSAETIVLATRDKLGAASPYGILPLAEIGAVVVAPGLPETVLAPVRAAGARVVEAA